MAGHFPHRRRREGFTLVEMLVCMALALGLSLAAVAAAIGSRASLTAQDESARLVETGLHALSVIERAVRQAGFEPWSGSPSASLSSFVLGLDDASLPGTSAALDGAQPPGINRSDVLALRYAGSGRDIADGSMLNCAGVGVAEAAAGDMENGRGWSIFHIARSDGGEPELRCKYRSEDGLEWDSQAVAGGVEAMQVLYGLDQDGDGLADRYRRAGDIADPLAWKAVVSVRVSLLLRSSQFQADLSGNQVHALFGNAYAAQASQDAGVRFDESSLPAHERKRLRRIFGITIALRNGAGNPVSAGGGDSSALGDPPAIGAAASGSASAVEAASAQGATSYNAAVAVDGPTPAGVVQ